MTAKRYYRLGDIVVSHDTLERQEIVYRDGTMIFMAGRGYSMGTEEAAVGALRVIGWALGAESLLYMETFKNPLNAVMRQILGYPFSVYPVVSNSDVYKRALSATSDLLGYLRERRQREAPPRYASDVATQAAADPAPAEAQTATSAAAAPPDVYYYISETGHVCAATFENDDTDKIRSALGNCYRTRAEAEARALNILGGPPREGAKSD